MALEFAGPATPMTESDIAAAARSIGCSSAIIKAVIAVESRGGFLPDLRPRILFERHYFSRLTARRHDGSHPDIAQPKPGGYAGGAREYDRLTRAITLDRDAALRSASWGAFQIMGDNCRLCGFAGVEAFVEAMVSGEPAQLRAFIAFLKSTGLDRALVQRDWVAFAKGYNGPGYRKNRYDTRLAEAYRQQVGAFCPGGTKRPLLRRGDQGQSVADLQACLDIAADGIFGRQTERSVMDWQRSHDLVADGIVGTRTWASLLAEQETTRYNESSL